jgi:hypothetical protein
MKSTVILLLAGVLALFGSAVVLADDGDRATHRPFAEFATATWCGYCKYAHGALKEVFAEGIHDFYYVSHVTDKNSKSQQRCSVDYNVYGYPTVYFDGGYKVNVGAGSVPSAKAAYNSSLTQCEARPVADIDVEVKVEWMGGAKIQVCASVKNNEMAPYRGTVRAFITENKSSKGWKDTSGKLYTYCFLDYAINQKVNILGNDAWSLCVEWDGTTHGFPGITYDNITVIAAVFEEQIHQGYSYPPNKNPFDAHYVDDCAGARPNTLVADNYAIPEAGGTVNFTLYGYPENAGRNYLMMGSITGTDPGTPLPGGYVTLPLNWDVFTSVVISLANSSIFHNFMGTLGNDGTATATLNLPPVPGMAGVSMYYAYACNNKWDFVSNPVEIYIYP